MCPRCGKILILAGIGMSCKSKGGCDFYIRNEKFSKIVDSLYNPAPRQCVTFENNMAALNNLGHEVVVEDFSDSKFLQ